MVKRYRVLSVVVGLLACGAVPASAQVSDAVGRQIVRDAFTAAGGTATLKGDLPKVAALLRTIARDLNRADPKPDHWGVARKTSGTTCTGIACDIVCSGAGPAQIQYDVLEDAEGAADGPVPRWAKVPKIAVRVCEVMPAGGTPDPVPGPGPTPAPDPALVALTKRVEALAAQVSSLERAITALQTVDQDIRAEFRAEVQDIRARLAALPPPGSGPAPLPFYIGTGKFLGIPVTVISRPCQPGECQ